MRVVVALVVGAIGVAGCYSPTAVPGAPCTASGACPSGLVCDTRQAPPSCVVEPSGGPDGGGDAAIDAAIACGSGLCPASVPVCDDAVCRACFADDECASGMCNETGGECIAETRVLYVATSGTANGTCTRAMPCSTVSRALALVSTTRDAIRLAPGTYTGAFVIDTMVPVLLSGASRDRSTTRIIYPTLATASSIIQIRDNAVVAIESLVIADAPVTGVRIQKDAIVTMVGVDIENVGDDGIDVQSSTLTFVAGGINGTGGAGIEASSSTVTVRGSYISNNDLAGIAVSSSSYTVVNSVLASNRRGGMDISGIAMPGVFEFNTVVLNTGMINAAIHSTNTITATSSIFYRNGVPQVGPQVAVAYSLFDDFPPPGSGNVFGDPRFLDEPLGDFHIANNSPARDAAAPGATLAVDFDGDPRPSGLRSDIGADEIP